MAVRETDRATEQREGGHRDRVATLFSRMMRQAPQTRRAFVHDACSGDEGLFRELSEMLDWEERMGTFLSTPLISMIDFEAAERRFEPNQRIGENQRFEITRSIGEGGMAVVYEAFDHERTKRIAIKSPKLGYSFTNSPELEAALKVRHKNICLVNDTRSCDGFEFLTMEFVEGETLAERLRRGRLEPAEALNIARQICAGLKEAHRSNVIHRDLKPSNIMLTRADDGELRVVIMDFGLASELSLDEASEGGTPAYMAPEILGGARSGIASDIYSLGVILYEMITGINPFRIEELASRSSAGSPGIRSLSLIKTSKLWPKEQRPSRNVIPPRKLVPKLSRSWNSTIIRCLDPEPSLRYLDADSVIAAIEGEPNPLSYHFHRTVRTVERSRELQAVLALIFLSLLTAGSYEIYRYYIRMPEIPPGTKVLVENFGSDSPQFAGITVALKSQLEQSARFEVVADDKVVQVIKQMKLAPNSVLDRRQWREVALRCGAALILFGSVSGAPQGQTLNLHLERAKSLPLLPAAIWSQHYDADDAKALLAEVHNAALWVRKAAGEKQADIAQQDRPVEDTTTSSWQALQLYQQANQKYSGGDWNAALLLLDEALQADPQFALAHMRKADILISQQHYVEGYPEWKLAMELTDKSELTSRENLRIKGLYYEDIGDYQSAERSFHAYTIHYPNDFLAWFYWGSALDNLGRLVEARSSLQNSLDLAPDSASALVHLAQVCLALSDKECADKAGMKLLELPSSEWGNWLASYRALDSGSAALALQHATALRSDASLEWQSRSFLLEANLLAETGQRERAIATLEQGRFFDQQRQFKSAEAQKLVALAYLFIEESSPEKARAALSRATELDPNPKTLVSSGVLLARIGDLGAAERIVQELKVQPQIPFFQRAVHEVMADIEIAKGNNSTALSHFLAAGKLSRAWEANDEYLRSSLVGRNQAGVTQIVVSQLERPLALLYRSNNLPGIWADSFEHTIPALANPYFNSCEQASRYFRVRTQTNTSVDQSFQGFQLWYQNSCMQDKRKYL